MAALRVQLIQRQPPSWLNFTIKSENKSNLEALWLWFFKLLNNYCQRQKAVKHEDRVECSLEAAHDSWYHQSNDNYLDAPHLPFAYYSCTVPLFDNLNVLEQQCTGARDLRWRPGICLVLWSKLQFSLQPSHTAMRILDTQHLPFGVGGCPTHFQIPSMCQSKRNEEPPWYTYSHVAVHMVRIAEGGLLGLETC